MVKGENSVIFVTKKNKEVELAATLLGAEIVLETFDFPFNEIRSESIEKISMAKVKDAYRVTKKPTIALDTELFIKELNGCPQSYAGYCLETIGINGLLKLMEGVRNRECYIKQCLYYYDGIGDGRFFFEKCEGKLSKRKRGSIDEYGWIAIGDIFIPKGKKYVISKMSDRERADFLCERDNDSVFRQFKDWYVDYIKNVNPCEYVKMKRDWAAACDCLRRRGVMADISYETWIEPLDIVEINK